MRGSLSWGYSAKHNLWRCIMKVEKISMFGATTAKLFTDSGIVHVGIKNRKCQIHGEGDCEHVKYVFANKAEFEKIGANFNGGTAAAAPAKKDKPLTDKQAAAKKKADQKSLENAIGAKAAADKASKKGGDPIVPGKGGKPLAPEAKAMLDRTEKVRLEGIKAEAEMPDVPSGKSKLTKGDKEKLRGSQVPVAGAPAIKDTGLKIGTEVIAIHHHGLSEKDLTVHGFLRKEDKHKIAIERKNSKELVEIEKPSLLEIVEAPTPAKKADEKPAEKAPDKKKAAKPADKVKADTKDMERAIKAKAAFDKAEAAAKKKSNGKK